MPTKNIECQIAQGQIGRYVSGERFSSEALYQLEGHISECPDCQELVADRRAALLSMLGGTPSTRAAVHMDAPRMAPTPPVSSKPQGNPFAHALRQAAAAQQDTPVPVVERPQPEPTKPRLSQHLLANKPLLYMTALAAVLFGMSFFTRGGFGPKGGDMFASAPVKPAPAPVSTPAPATAKTETPVIKPPVTAATPTPKVVTPAATPTPPVAHAAPKRPSPKPVTPKPAKSALKKPVAKIAPAKKILAVKPKLPVKPVHRSFWHARPKHTWAWPPKVGNGSVHVYR